MNKLHHPDTLPPFLTEKDFSQFLSQQQRILENFESLVLALENGDTVEAPSEMYRILHTMKGESGFLALNDVQTVCHRAEDMLSKGISTGFADVLFQVKDWLLDTFSFYAGGDEPTAGKAEVLNLLESYENSGPVTDEDASSTIKEEKAKPAPGSTQGASLLKKNIIVDSDRLDHLINTIGELVTIETMVTENFGRSTRSSIEYENGLKSLKEITKELQRVGLRLRMIPLKSLFEKMRRIARDLSKKQNKQFDFIIKGEETELDKNLVDALSEPLIHIIRNCVDHGIEKSSQERQEAGKPGRAMIELTGAQKGENLYIEIQDDGRGIHTEKLMTKAIAKGLVDPENLPDQTTALQLVFHPGLSSSDQVSDISGRGIGMDVVKQTISQFGGKINIASEKGKGTRIQIKLPLSMAIMDGIVVGERGQKFILPTLSVITSRQFTPDMVTKVLKKGECIYFHDQPIPLFRMDSFLDLFPEDAAQLDSGIVIVVEDAGMKAALLVEKVINKQSVVRKNLGHAVLKVPGISGGSIMSDGKVCLILDIPQIVAIANNRASF